MTAVDIIARKRDGHALERGEVIEFVEAAAGGAWPDYQLSAMLMAIVLRGMDGREVEWLIESMLASGATLEWQGWDRPLVDKHSTGGVGDKLSLVVAPLAAACGAAVPMLSGRGLAHTGGTLDKLEAIPGFRADLEVEEIREIVENVGCVICGTTTEMVPADRVLYRLRDATATVESLPLICGSILSKKLAGGVAGLVLDVKCGQGGVVSELEAAVKLAQALVSGGTKAGLRTGAVVTRMDVPLGMTVGNAIEVSESIEVLKGGGPGDVRELSLRLVSHMLVMAGLSADVEAAFEKARAALDGGVALEVFGRMVEAQGGEQRIVENPTLMPAPRHVLRIDAECDGFVDLLPARGIGQTCVALGAGRVTATDSIDPTAGIRILAATGTPVTAGDPVLELVASDRERIEHAAGMARECVSVTVDPVEMGSLVLETVNLADREETVTE